MANQTLQEAIQNAVNEQVETSQTDETVETKETKETDKEVKSEIKKEEEKQDEQILEVAETEEQIQQALQIYRTLNDPNTASQFISEMAKTVGLQLEKSEIKLSPKVAAQTVVDVLKEALGEENEDLALKLAPALEKLISSEVKKPISDLTIAQQAKEVEKDVNIVFDKMSTDLPDFKKLEPQMVQLMQQIQPGPRTTVEEYLTMLYKLAGGSQKVSSVKIPNKVSTASVVEKLKNNANETKTNVSGDVDESRIQKGSHRPTIREAVLAAAQELNKQRN